MRGVRYYLVAIAVVLIIPVSAQSQQWAGILSSSRAIDWSNVGVHGGIPVRNTICATLNPGATAAQISSAVSSCANNGVVFLNAGTYNLSGGIVFGGKSGVTLRGAGANQTLLVFSAGNACHGWQADVCMDSFDTNWVGGPSNSANWTAGYSQGTTSITLSGHTNLVVGQPLILDQGDDAADTGSKYVCQSNSTSPPCSLEGNNNNGARTNRDQQQIVQVVSCGASTLGAACTSNSITINPALYALNWNSNKSPGAWWPTTPAMLDGIENLSIDNTASTGSRGIQVFNCMDCWVTGTRGIDSARSHIEIWSSARVTVRNNYFYLTQDAVSQSYGVSPYGSSDVLIENNIFQYITTPLQVNGCDGCVFGYNYTINNYYEGSVGYVMPSIMMHTAGDDYILSEGNVVAQTLADVFHGSQTKSHITVICLLAVSLSATAAYTFNS